MGLHLIWFLLSNVAMALEIFVPSFLFMSVGISAAISGVIAYRQANLIIQITSFIVISSLVFLLFKKKEKAWFEYRRMKKNVINFIGAEGVVTKTVRHKGIGYVEVDNDELPAIHKDQTRIEFALGERVHITDIKKNRLIVELIDENKKERIENIGGNPQVK